MKKTVFYSWQSDLPNGTNRTLIESALNEAAKEIGADEDADIEAVIDRDTQGMSGSPNIATAIFEKIDKADIFVADVSIIGNAKKRAVPNPNVLIELGYALKSLGHERIILVFNTAFGKVEKLPFDLRMNRAITYKCNDSVTDRSSIKKELTKDFKSALTTGFSHTKQNTTPKKDIIEIIKTNIPSKKIDIREHLATVLTELEKIQPVMKRDNGTVEDLIESINKSESISLEFAKMTETIALMDDMDLAKEVFQWFGKILTKYDPIHTGTGQTWNCDGDFYKFIGHELFTIFLTPFLRERKFDEIKEILRDTLQTGPTAHNVNGGKTPWTELSQYSPLLADEEKKRNRTSFHADLLKAVFEKESMKPLVSVKDFAETDFFLGFYGEGKTEDRYRGNWYPRIDIWLNTTPGFVIDAIDYSTAIKICSALRISDVDEFKKRMRHLAVRFDWSSPFDERDIAKVGTTGGAQIILG